MLRGNRNFLNYKTGVEVIKEAEKRFQEINPGGEN